MKSLTQNTFDMIDEALFSHDIDPEDVDWFFASLKELVESGDKILNREEADRLGRGLFTLYREMFSRARQRRGTPNRIQ